MFTGGKSVLACAPLLLALAAQTSARAIPSPAFGAKGAPARSDVQRPSTAKVARDCTCGSAEGRRDFCQTSEEAEARDVKVARDNCTWGRRRDGICQTSEEAEARDVKLARDNCTWGRRRDGICQTSDEAEARDVKVLVARDDCTWGSAVGRRGICQT